MLIWSHVEALQRGLPAAKRVEDAGTGFEIKTALAELLKLAQGGILETNSIAPKNGGVDENKCFMRHLLGLASQHLMIPLWALTGKGASFEWFLQATGADAVVGTDSTTISGSADWSITSV